MMLSEAWFCCMQWCIAKNGGRYMQRGVAKGLKVPCLFMITEVSIRCQKYPGGWYTEYTRVYPPVHHWLHASIGLWLRISPHASIGQLPKQQASLVSCCIPRWCATHICVCLVWFVVQLVPTLLCSCWHDVDRHSTSCGPSAVAELHVCGITHV